MYGFEYKLLAIVFSVMMLVQAFVIRLAVGTYIIPAAIFSLAWFVYTFFPLVILFNVPINPFSILYIFLCTLAFSLSALPFNWSNAFKANETKKSVCEPQLDSKFIRCCLYISIVLSIVFSTYSMVLNGYDLKSIFFDPIATSGRFAAMRGTKGLEYGIIGTLSVFFTYIAPVLGGFVSYSQKTRSWKMVFLALSLTPALYIMVTQSSKLVLFVASSLYLASILLMKIYAGKTNLFKISYMPKSIGIIFLLLPLVLISFISREGYFDSGNLSRTIGLLRFAITSYTLGEIYAFSDFFSFYVGMESVSTFLDDFNSFGYYTFASIFNTFGITRVFSPGIYMETGHFDNVFETNIFTIFRGLIYDFGGLGSFIFIFCFGLVVHAFFYRLLSRQNSRLASVVFITSIVFIVTSYLFSVFLARYMFLNGLGLYIILLVNSKLTKNSETYN
ncbi:MAG: O-antigen polymerase [bacterium]